MTKYLFFIIDNYDKRGGFEGFEFGFKLPEIPKRNVSRDIRKFLILPKKLNREMRWLEFATIAQKWNWYYEEWQDHEWID